MKKNLPPTPSLKRPSGFIKPKVEIIIACEGKNTEPRYFMDCINEYGAGLVRLRILPVTGVPMTLVNEAIEERSALIKKCRKSRDSFDSCFRVWAVFDRDSHPGVAEALELASRNGIDVAFSDPCFEIWPLLHLVDYGAQDDRHHVQARLKAEMPSYDHESEAVVDFQSIKDRFLVARDRSERHRLARVAEGVPLGRPSTTVDILVQKIIENGKKGKLTTVA